MGNLSNMIKTANEYYNEDLLEKIFNGEYTADEVLKKIDDTPNIKTIYNQDGSVGWRYLEVEKELIQPQTQPIGDNINSNTTKATATYKNRVKFNIPINIQESATTAGKYVVKSGALKTVGGVLSKANTIAAAGSVAYTAASAAITLGKKIEKGLYNLNPDFWDAHGMETLNPDTWGTIVNSDSAFDKVFRFLFDVDSEGNTIEYIEEDVLAYVGDYIKSVGGYSIAGYYIDENTIDEEFLIYDKVNYTPLFTGGGVNIHKLASEGVRVSSKDSSGTSYDDYAAKVIATSLTNEVISTTYLPSPYPDATTKKNIVTITVIDSDNKTELEVVRQYTRPDGTIGQTTSASTIAQLKNGFEAVRNSVTLGYGTKSMLDYVTYPPKVIRFDGDYSLDDITYILIYGDKLAEKTIEGITDQEEAIIPDLSTVNTLDEIKTLIRTTLPDLYTNSRTISTINDDGTITTKTYIPITSTETTSQNDTQPTTGNQTQGNNKISEDTLSETLTETITKTASHTPTKTTTPTTGGGSTPTIVIPTAGAMGLWAIYNPTESELKSFGAWLWSDSLIEQIKKLFSSPMDAIIGVHKVYAPVITSGKSTIQVGYINSGVSSNIVSQQYVSVDCGSIDLYEYFGNVFDYDGYTKIQLYLPFIGIVPLQAEYVMRSTISVKYGIDVLTGACLAMVNVKRDASGGVIYQYSGNCAVTYPISSGSYMGIVSSVLGMAGSIAGGLASGGIIPMVAGLGMTAMNTHTTVQHSGTFSGNSGAMGARIPYLIISRPQDSMPDDYSNIIGNPAYQDVIIGDIQGYTEFSKVILKNINCFKDELLMIEAALLQGVYL